MKRVLLINPPRNQYSSSNQLVVGLPLGLMSLASYLQKHSISVSILDCLTECFEAKQNKNYITYGMPLDELSRRVSCADFDIIGISFPFSTQSDICIETVNVVKKALPRALIIAGGAHVTVAASELMRASSQIDVCVIGEGEKTLYELVNNYNSENKAFASLGKIKGIVYRDALGNLQRTAPRENMVDLDELGYPAYDLIDTAIHIPADSFFALSNGLFSENYYTESFKVFGFYAYDDFFEFGLRIGMMESRIMKLMDKYRNENQKVLALTQCSFLTEPTKQLYKNHYKDRLKMLNTSYSGKI